MSLQTHNTDDRRVRRSDRLQDAVHYQLVHTSEAFGLDLITVCDADGHLMASSTATYSPLGSLLSEVVAAFSPLIAHEEKGFQAPIGQRLLNELRQLGLEWEVDELTVCEFHANGQRLYLTVLGGDPYMRDIGTYRVIFGIRRIWEQTTPEWA